MVNVKTCYFLVLTIPYSYMPELPEVQTTVNGLNKHVIGKRIMAVWSDLPKKKVARKDFEKTIKSEKFFQEFEKSVIGKKIVSAKRRAKNILIELSSRDTIHIHMKMTGHLMYGKYEYSKKTNSWKPKETKENTYLLDPYNRFVHLVFTLSDGKQLVMSDSRKFAKVTLIQKGKDIEIELGGLGPEPLDKSFSFEKFENVLLTKKNWPVKHTLLDQGTIAGIGNIYSDEMLWSSNISPKSITGKIPRKELSLLYKSMKIVLQKGLDFGGDSMSDYRNIEGKPGSFHHKHNVYRKKGQACRKKNCSGVILREVVKGRSAHFCSEHQELFR